MDEKAAAAGKNGTKDEKGASDESGRPIFSFKERFYGPLFAEAGRLLAHGKRTTLREDDLLKPENMRTEKLYAEFLEDLETEKQRTREKHGNAADGLDESGETLIRAVIARERRELAFCGILFAVYNGLQFIGPIFLKEILSGLSCKAYSPFPEACDSNRKLFMYCALICVAPLVGGFAYSHHQFRMFALANRVRSRLMAAVYDKCLRLSSAATSAVGTGKIVSLMSSDTESLRLFIPQIHSLWAAPLFIAGSIFLLYEELQWCAFLGFFAIIFVVPMAAVVFIKLYAFRKKITVLQDKRTNIMNEIIGGIRVIKYYTWERAFKSTVGDIRTKELELIWDQAWISAFFGVILFAAPTLISVMAIGAYSLVAGNELTTTRAYTSLALFNILRIPLAMLPMTVQQFSNAKVSFKRLTKFFSETESDPLQSERVVSAENGDANGTDGDTKTTHATTATTTQVKDCESGAMRLEKCKFLWTTEVMPNAEGNTQGPTAAGSPPPVALKETGETNGTERDNDDIKLEMKAANSGTNADATKSDKGSGTKERRGKRGSEDRGFVQQPVLVQWELRDINIKVDPGTLMMVVGEVGSGKSSLMSALSGYMPLVKGTRVMPATPSIAVVTQVPWILNDTLRGNVLFGKDYDREKYEAAIEAAQLLPDLEILNGGDMTEIGERGVTLSGGQKQRVSIARCIYADADIVIMDDPLSAVDAHVGAKLFEHVLSSETGCLKNKTRVLVTNALQYLPKADHIVVMKRIVEGESDSTQKASHMNGKTANGHHAKHTGHGDKNRSRHNSIGDDTNSVGGMILEQGTYEELVADGLRFADLVKAHNVDDSDDEAKADDDSEESSSTKSNSSSDDVDVSMARPADEDNHKDKDGNITGSEECENGAVSPRVYWEYALAAGGAKCVAVVMFTFALDYGVRAFMDYWLTFWAEDTFKLERDYPGKHYYLQIYVYIFLCNTVTTYFRSVILYAYSVKAARNLHEKLLSRVMRLPMTFFDTTPSGRVLNRFGRDTLSNDTEIAAIIIQTLGCVFAIITTFVLISVASPWFLVAVPVIAIIYVYLQRFYIPSGRELQRIESISLSPIYSNFAETVNGIPIIRAFQNASYFIAKNNMFVYKNACAFMTQKLAVEWLSLRLDALGAVVLILTAYFIVHGKVDPGIAGIALVYALDVTKFMKFGTQMASQMELKMNSVERIVQYFDLDEEADEDTSPSNKDALVSTSDKENFETLMQSWPSEGDIVIENITMRYRPELPVVLRGLSLHIRAGDRIGIVGRTGSGKSSILQAIMRTVELESGSIRIDGVDISKLGLSDLRSGIGIIPQDPVLFGGSLRRNVDPFGAHEDPELARAVRNAGLTDMRLDDEIQDGGSNLSVGQRQLVCLARALVAKSKILLLDEATASVDYETDARIQNAIVENFCGYNGSTVISIAHRLNTVMDYDKVLVMEDGVAAEYGEPHMLLYHDVEGEVQKKNGALSGLVDKTGSKNASLLRSISKKSFDLRRKKGL